MAEGADSVDGTDADTSFKGAGGETTMSDVSGAGEAKDVFTTALSQHSPALSPQPSDYYDIMSPHPDEECAGATVVTMPAGDAYAAVDVGGGPATDGSWRTATSATSASELSPVEAAGAAAPDEHSASLALPESSCAAPAAAAAAAASAETAAATHVQLRPADVDAGTSSLSESTAEMISTAHTRNLHSRSQATSHSASSALAGPDTPALNALLRGPASGGRSTSINRAEAALTAVAATSPEERLDIVASLGHLVPAESRHDSSSVSASTSRLHDSSAIPRPSSGPDFHIPSVPMLDLSSADARQGDGSWIPGPLRSPIFSEGASFITCDTTGGGETCRAEQEAQRGLHPMPLGPVCRIPTGRDCSPPSSSTGTIALQGSTSELAAAAADRTVSDWSGVVPPRKVPPGKGGRSGDAPEASAGGAPGFAPQTPRSDSSAESLAPEESFQFSPHGSPMQVPQPMHIAAPVTSPNLIRHPDLPAHPAPPIRPPSPAPSPPPAAANVWSYEAMLPSGPPASQPASQPAPEPDPDEDCGSFVSCDSATSRSGMSGDSRSILSSMPGDSNHSGLGDSNQGSSISVPLATYTAGLTTARTAHDGDSGYVAGESALLESPREEPVGSDSGVVDGARVIGQVEGARGELAAAAAAAAAQEAEDLGLGVQMMAGFPWVTTGLPAILEPALGESERLGSDSGYIAEASGHFEGSQLLGTLSQASPRRGRLNGVVSTASSAASSGAITAAAAGSSSLPAAALGSALGALRAPAGSRAVGGLRAQGAQPLMWPPPRGRQTGAMGKTTPGMKVAGGVITKQRGSQLGQEANRDGLTRGEALESEASLATSAYFGSEVSSLPHDGEPSIGEAPWRHRSEADGHAECGAAAMAAAQLSPDVSPSPSGSHEATEGARLVMNGGPRGAEGANVQSSERVDDADSGRVDLTGSTLQQFVAEGQEVRATVGEGALSTLGAGDSFTRGSAPLSPPAQALSPDLEQARGGGVKGGGQGGMTGATQLSASAFSVPSTPGVTQRLLESDFAAMFGEGSVEMDRMQHASMSPSARGLGSAASPVHAQHTAGAERFRVLMPSGLAPTPPQSPPPVWPPSRASTPALGSPNSVGARSTSSRESAPDIFAEVPVRGVAAADGPVGEAAGGGARCKGPERGGAELMSGPRSDAAVLPIPAELDMDQQRITSAPEPSSLRAWAEETLDTGADVTVLAAAAGHAEPDGSQPASPESPVGAGEPAPQAGKPAPPSSGGRGRGRGSAAAARGRARTPAAASRSRGSGSRGPTARNAHTAPRGRPASSSIPRPVSGDSLELSPPRALTSLQRPRSAEQPLRRTAATALPAPQSRRGAGATAGSPGRAIGEARMTSSRPRGDRSATRRGDTPRPASPADPHPSAIPPPKRSSPKPPGDYAPSVPSSRCSPEEGPTVVSAEFSGDAGYYPARDGSQGGAAVPATTAVRALCQELDSVPSGVLLCGKFQMLGRSQRRIGSAPPPPLFQIP